MKAFHILAAGIVLCAALASCEMKDELKGTGNGTNADMGYLDLGVAVNGSQNNVTKAEVEDGDIEVGATVSAEDFPVVITGVTNASFIKEFASYAELKAEGEIELPVGKYSIAAHSNLDLKDEMTEPYYDGTEEIDITKGVTSKADVVCKMKNTKIAMSYTGEFTSNFDSWTITVTDGKTILEFICEKKTTEELNPAPLYMLVQEGVSELTVRVSAVNKAGEQVSESRTLTKPAGGDSSNWTGGDALTIEMSGYTPEPDVETGIVGSGITINADVEFEESEDKIEVPVTPGGEEDDNTETEEPGTGDDDNEEEGPVTSNLPTITLPKTTYTLPDDMEADANVLIETALKEGSSNEYVGLKSVFVKIIPGNDGFSAALDALLAQNIKFKEGVELVGNKNVEFYISLIAPGLKVPDVNAPNYTFPVGAFFSTLGGSDMGITSGEGHIFEITVTDNNNRAANARLSIKVDSVVDSVE